MLWCDSCGVQLDPGNPSISDSLHITYHTPVPQVLPYRLIEPPGLGLLFPQLSYKAAHLFLEGFVFFRCLHVVPRSEDVVVVADLLNRRTLTETGDIPILTGIMLPRQAWYVRAVCSIFSSECYDGKGEGFDEDESP